MKRPETNPAQIPGTKTIHKIHYFEGLAELRGKTEQALTVECFLKRECNIFTHDGRNTIFQDGEIIGHITFPAHADLSPFLSDSIAETTMHLSNGATLRVRWLEPNGKLRCVPIAADHAV